MQKFCKENSIYIYNFDIRVKEADIRLILRGHTPRINSVKIVRKYTFSCASVSFTKNVPIIHILQRLRNQDLEMYGIKLKFCKFKKKEEFFCISEKMRMNLPYDLSPQDTSLPNGHMLVDDILLRIFNHLSFTDLVSCADVCRRFQSLARILLIERLREYKDGCFLSWFFENKLYDFLTRSVRLQNTQLPTLLLTCGDALKKIELEPYHGAAVFFNFIGMSCQNLEEVSISRYGNSVNNNTHVQHLTRKCTFLKSVTVNKHLNMENDFITYLRKLKSLETLKVNTLMHVNRKNLAYLPKSLKKFSCLGECDSDKPIWTKLFQMCRQLEVFEISARTPIRTVDMKQAVKYCPNMKEIRVCFAEDESIFDWSLFPKLKKLAATADIVNMNSLALCENLEELTIISSTFSSTTLIGRDFSSLKNLRRLTLSVFPYLDMDIIKSINGCEKLEYLQLSDVLESMSHLLPCIEQNNNLTDLVCKDYSLTEDDFRLLYEAGKKRKTILRLMIHVPSAETEFDVHQLEEVNFKVHVHDISVFSSNGLFEIDDDYLDGFSYYSDSDADFWDSDYHNYLTSDPEYSDDYYDPDYYDI